jgi:hypothetical protein
MMTVSTNKHAIALSGKEFSLLETVHRLGPCSSERIQDTLRDPDLLGVMRSLHDLTSRGFLVRPEIDEQLLYQVKPNYHQLRQRLIVMEAV